MKVALNTINQTINFAIINCQHLTSNISTAPSCGVYISKLIRYAWVCSLYLEFLQHHRLLSTILLSQGYLKNHLIFFSFGIYQHLVERSFVTCIQMTTDGIGNSIMVQDWLLFPYYVLRWSWVLSDLYLMATAIGSLL